ncbi:MAG: hypothetical protein ATN36_01670 [Epulopiscium sp. Nele67-Bin005]|nr:MAG: hypothetical protein ATN36_01670 [Epulopiscium sp. Nele67-Bin005]
MSKKLKRKLALILGLTISSNTNFMQIYATENNIDAHWAEDSITKIQSFGVLEEFNNTNFRPNDYVTRAEVAMYLQKLFGFSVSQSKYYDDVENVQWYANAVNAVTSQHIMNDYGTSFRPNDLATREEVIFALSQAYNLTDNQIAYFITDTADNQVSSWAKDAVEIFVQKGYIEGRSDGQINPQEPITQAEFAVLLDRLTNTFIKDAGNYSFEIVEGNLFIANGDINLKNTIIEGDAYITSGVSEGIINLDNVEIKGTLYIEGGEEILLTGLSAQNVIVNAPKSVLIKGDKSTEFQKLTVKSEVTFNGDLIIVEANIEYDGVNFENTPQKVSFSQDTSWIKVNGRTVIANNLDEDGQISNYFRYEGLSSDPFLSNSSNSIYNSSTFDLGQVSMPMPDVLGGSFDEEQFITLETKTDDTIIYYTLDGSNTTVENGIIYDGKPIHISQPTTIKAIATKFDMVTSPMMVQYYEVPDKNQVTTPRTSIQSGVYNEAQLLHLSTITEEAQIYYTLDGTTPTIDSIKYEEPIFIENTTTLKAIAVSEDMQNSHMITEKYTINKYTKKFLTNLHDDYVTNIQSTIEPFATTKKRTIFEQNNLLVVVDVMGDGTDNLSILIQGFDEDLERVLEKEIHSDLSIYGGFFEGDDGFYYIVYGEQNLEQNNHKEVVRVVQYDEKFNEISHLSINNNDILRTASQTFDINVAVPFTSSTVDIAQLDNELVIHTGKTGYVYTDGFKHQSGITFVINLEDMSLKPNTTRNASHSFDQYVKYDNGSLFRLELGDAYPRSIVLRENFDRESFVYDIGGKIGNNETGIQIGGFEISDRNYIVGVNKIDYGNILPNGTFLEESSYNREVILFLMDKVTYRVTEITLGNYLGTSQTGSAPKIISLENGEYFVMWTEFLYDKYSKEELAQTLNYVKIDGNGKALSDIRTIENVRLSDYVQPIVRNNEIVWVAGDYYYSISLE